MSSEIIERYEKKNKKPDYAMRRLAAVAMLSGVLLGGVKSVQFIADGGIDKVADKMKNPYEYSEETMAWRAEPGDGLNDAAVEVEGFGGFDRYDIRRIAHYIKNMPENEAVLSDGLQVGEYLSVPKTVNKK